MRHHKFTATAISSGMRATVCLATLAIAYGGAVCGQEYRKGCLLGTSMKNHTNTSITSNCCLECWHAAPRCAGVNLRGRKPEGGWEVCEFMSSVVDVDEHGACSSQQHPGGPTPAPAPTPVRPSFKLCVTDPKTFGGHWITCCTDEGGGCTLPDPAAAGTHSATVSTLGGMTVALKYPTGDMVVQLPAELSGQQKAHGILRVPELDANWTACTAEVPDEECCNLD